MVTDYRAALAIRACRPIAAGYVLSSRNSRAILLSAGKHVVLVGSVTAAINNHAFLVESRLFVDLVLFAVQVRQIRCDLHTFRIEPRAVTNPVLSVDPTRALSRKVGAPRLAACANGLGKALTVAISALKSTKITTFSEPDTGDEKTHRRLLGKS